MTMVRRSTRTILWIMGITMMRPGPLTFQNRPSWKITPRWYSCRILIALTTKRTAITIRIVLICNSSMVFLLSSLVLFLSRLDLEREPVDSRDLEELALHDGGMGARLPARAWIASALSH